MDNQIKNEVMMSPKDQVSGEKGHEIDMIIEQGEKSIYFAPQCM